MLTIPHIEISKMTVIESEQEFDMLFAGYHIAFMCVVIIG
jgi:hypothetical protein